MTQYLSASITAPAAGPWKRLTDRLATMFHGNKSDSSITILDLLQTTPGLMHCFHKTLDQDGLCHCCVKALRLVSRQGREAAYEAVTGFSLILSSREGPLLIPPHIANILRSSPLNRLRLDVMLSPQGISIRQVSVSSPLCVFTCKHKPCLQSGFLNWWRSEPETEVCLARISQKQYHTKECSRNC